MRRSPNLQIMVQAAQKAARSLARDFGEVEQLQVSIKGPGDFVSAADRRAEKLIVDELRRARPGFGFLAEEGGADGKEATSRWIIDPLDGTSNFLHGLPHFAISIALETQGELVAGLVFDPIKQEVFTAEKGQGAYMNDRRLRVSARKELERSMVACGLPVLDWAARERGFMAQLDRVSGQVAGVRRFGAASLDLAYVAAGRLDGFWEYGLKPWDVAAGIVLVREAGGQLGTLEGGELMDGGTLLAANPQIYPRFHALVAG
ncbi:MAG: inositol monophosphatase [Geminicoccaceae bacterium]|nr:MAG: inositol monophosphatase [Geminicoccaceae bacterium]